MVRFTSLVLSVLLATAFAVADVPAQSKPGKKKSAQCVPNFFEACMKRCMSSRRSGRHLSGLLQQAQGRAGLLSEPASSESEAPPPPSLILQARLAQALEKARAVGRVGVDRILGDVRARQIGLQA